MSIDKVLDEYINKLLDETKSQETSAAAGLPGFDSPHTNVRKKNKEILQDEENEEVVDRESKRLMIDFDGVIHSYHEGWKDGSIYGYVIEGSKETINELSETHQIVIFTTRASSTQPNQEQSIKDVEDWLNKNDIYFDFITADKLAAELYIDDNAVRFENNWDEIKSRVKG